MKRASKEGIPRKVGIRVKIWKAIRPWFRRLRMKLRAFDKKASPPEAVTRSLRETSKILGLHPSTVYRLAARKMIVPVPGLRHLRFTTEEIDRFLKGGNRG